MPEKTNVGIIGCGFFAQNHLHSWHDLQSGGVNITAVCDIDAAKAQAAAHKFSIPRWYTDARTMLHQEKLNLVDIITRQETHRELVELAIQHRVPTIVQKPFAPDLASCAAMAETAKKAGVFLAVHENFRFQKPMRKLVEVLRSGEIGAPSWARISFRTGYDVYQGQPYLMNEQRLVILDLGVHVLDLARTFMGEAECISAETQRRNPQVRGEDTATMLLRHRSGTVSVVECTYESRRLPDNFPETVVEIEGSRGAVSIDAGLIMHVTADGRRRSIDVDVPLLSWARRPWHVVQESVLATCSHMISSLRAGLLPDTSAEDNLRTFALAEAAYSASTLRKLIFL
jgi:D-apiose dehydrogenase